MTAIPPSADHMKWAMQAIYTGNSAPELRRFPSGGVMVSTGEQDVFGNFAIGLDQDELAEAAEHLTREPVMSMFLAPGEPNPNYESAIEPFGYGHVGAIPAMTADLGAIPAVEVPAGYRFERLKAGAGGSAWAETLSAGYPVATKAARSMSPVHAVVSDAPDAPMQFFQVLKGDQVAGVSALALLNGIAGIYCVATLPDHRRKGIGAALTALPLQIAKGLGYSTAVLQASEAGYPIYRKLGFEDSGAVQLYLRMPPGMEASH